MNKRELLDSIRTERARLEELVARFDDDAMLRPVLDGGRSVKDLLAHIAAWEGYCAGWLEAVARGVTPDRPEVRDVDATNARDAAAAKAASVGDVRARSQAAHAAMLASIEGLSDADLADEKRFGWPTWQMASSNSDEHDREHIDEIERYLSGGAAV